jgi:hypothetical protein
VRDRDEVPVVRLGSRLLSVRRAAPNRAVVRLPQRHYSRRLVVQTHSGFWAAVPGAD